MLVLLYHFLCLWVCLFNCHIVFLRLSIIVNDSIVFLSRILILEWIIVCVILVLNRIKILLVLISGLVVGGVFVSVNTHLVFNVVSLVPYAVL